MAVIGVLVGLVVGLVLTQVPRLPMIVKFFIGMAVLAALVFAYLGLDAESAAKTAWSVGLMTAVLVIVAVQLWRSRNGTHAH